ncbi:uncharacterized protein B0I36DRAFT_389729 [Microdochium trichocladiopsis]|uniref:Uncharacterized protein n=1 Tax=Microdochium trichocladiopsis TaxID=1682393 RepID=A0A9P8XR25_9PEZI|nr:uncharacterized protein B0I36DRAFT_389729 [Microdochium trichocladiopsis]KAH7012282.1 hypothetical protein B0I36DRAFT_389729 [Microdochium trichocladiopsis]
MAQATNFCGNCFLQRFIFGNDTVLSNGYSITVYPKGVDSLDLNKIERTWGNVYAGKDPKYEYSMGPLRDRVPDSDHKTYYLKYTEVRADLMRQLCSRPHFPGSHHQAIALFSIININPDLLHGCTSQHRETKPNMLRLQSLWAEAVAISPSGKEDPPEEHTKDLLQELCEGVIHYILSLDERFRFEHKVVFAAVNIALHAILKPEKWAIFEPTREVLYAKVGSACLDMALGLTAVHRAIVEAMLETAVMDTDRQLSMDSILSTRASILHRIGHCVNGSTPIHFLDFVYPPDSRTPLEQYIRFEVLRVLRAVLVEPSFFSCSASQMVAAAVSATWRRRFGIPWAEPLDSLPGHHYEEIKWIADLL